MICFVLFCYVGLIYKPCVMAMLKFLLCLCLIFFLILILYLYIGHVNIYIYIYIYIRDEFKLHLV